RHLARGDDDVALVLPAGVVDNDHGAAGRDVGDGPLYVVQHDGLRRGHLWRGHQVARGRLRRAGRPAPRSFRRGTVIPRPGTAIPRRGTAQRRPVRHRTAERRTVGYRTAERRTVGHRTAERRTVGRGTAGRAAVGAGGRR